MKNNIGLLLAIGLGGAVALFAMDKVKKKEETQGSPLSLSTGSGEIFGSSGGGGSSSSSGDTAKDSTNSAINITTTADDTTTKTFTSKTEAGTNAGTTKTFTSSTSTSKTETTIPSHAVSSGIYTTYFEYDPATKSMREKVIVQAPSYDKSKGERVVYTPSSVKVLTSKGELKAEYYKPSLTFQEYDKALPVGAEVVGTAKSADGGTTQYVTRKDSTGTVKTYVKDSVQYHQAVAKEMGISYSEYKKTVLGKTDDKKTSKKK